MKKNKKLFLTMDNVFDSTIKNLYYDLILFEERYPVLFTCENDLGELYLSSCYFVNGQRQEWILASVSEDTVIKLLSDNITIQDAFTKNNSKILVIKREGDSLLMDALPIEQVPTAILPSAGYYMDAEDGEFDDEIAILEQRRLTRLSAMATPSQQKVVFTPYTVNTSFFMPTTFKRSTSNSSIDRRVIYERKSIHIPTPFTSTAAVPA